MIYFSNEVKEVSYDYTECFSAETPDVLCADKLESNPSKPIVIIIEKNFCKKGYLRPLGKSFPNPYFDLIR